MFKTPRSSCTGKPMQTLQSAFCLTDWSKREQTLGFLAPRKVDKADFELFSSIIYSH